MHQKHEVRFVNMKSVLHNIIILLMIAVGTIACDKETEKEIIDDKDFSSYLTMEDISKTIPIVNEFLENLPDTISKEKTFEELVTWMNSFSRQVNAKIIYSTDFYWGNKVMSGVSVPVDDNGITRELELDFAIIDNAISYSQIAGYVYNKQDIIYVKTQYTNIDSVFKFINSLDLVVNVIENGTYLSSLPAKSDTLAFIIEKLKAKPYTNKTWVTGHLNWYNANMVIFIHLYNMKIKDYQIDWKATMGKYKLENYASGPKHIIAFYIPEGTGKQWETRFTEYNFVDWAESGYSRYKIR